MMLTPNQRIAGAFGDAPGAPLGMFGNPAAAPGGGIMAGLNSMFTPGQLNQALLMAGLGLLGGGSPRQQMQQGLAGYATGHALDEKQRKDTEQRKALDEVLAGDTSLTPAEKKLAALSPDSYLRMRYATPKLPTSVQEYQVAQSDPQFAQFLRDNKGGVTIDMSGNKFAQETGKLFGEEYVNLQKGVTAAQSRLNDLDVMESALADPGVYQGAGGESVLKLKKIARAAGLDEENMGPAELASAIGNKMALEFRNPAGGAGMPGAMSDKDREFLQTLPPGLSKTPEGNRLIISVHRRIEQRKIQIAQFASEYVNQNGELDGGFYQALAQWSEQNPLFADMQQMINDSSGGVNQTRSGVRWSVGG